MSLLGVLLAVRAPRHSIVESLGVREDLPVLRLAAR